MMENSFKILGIEPTKNQELIRKAYRSLLHQVNPEDDPVGFQRLREAYEEASRYAKTKEETVEKEKTETERFIDRCLELYEDFYRRIVLDEWETLFESDICYDLEMEEEVRKTFLVFLMEHFHLPTEVWKLIDRTFQISNNRKELLEWFPEPFVDFLFQAVQYEGVLNYELFEGMDDEDFDGYIEIYQRLRQYTDLGMVEQAEKELDTVKIEDEVTDVVCEECGRNMVIKYGPHGKFLACPGFPECKNTKPYLEKIGVACPKCGKDIVLRKTKKGRKYYGCEDNPECDFMSWQKPSTEKCPKCGSYMVEKGNKLVCGDEHCGYVKNK